MVKTVAIAGTTEHTVMCARALLADDRFKIVWILTPEPKKIGRKQVLTANPMDLFGKKHGIPVLHVKNKIDAELKDAITSLEDAKPDFLLVVDFGYFVPDWLLKLPNIAPVNIHPSELPKYRGSSPGQFALLFGEKESAISVIKMNEFLDQGDLIYQFKFDILSTFSTQSYYDHAFELVSQKLPKILSDFAEGKITPRPQPLESPTAIARRLNREDGFVSWQLLATLRDADVDSTSELLQEARTHFDDWASTLDHALRAFTPWPGLWTLVPTKKGEKRMKILSIKPGSAFELDQVQIEGYPPTEFNQLRTLLA